MQEAVNTHWRDTLYEAGLGDEEMRRLEVFFKEIPTHQIESQPVLTEQRPAGQLPPGAKM